MAEPIQKEKTKWGKTVKEQELLELHQQATVVTLLRRYPYIFSAIPNGHVRTRNQQLQARQEGVQPGMPDLMIFTSPPALPQTKGVALEMKRRSGRSRDVRTNQRKMLKDLAAEGFVPLIGYGSKDAIAHLVALGYFPDLDIPESAVPHPMKLARFCKLIGMGAAPIQFFSQAAQIEEDLVAPPAGVPHGA